MRWLKIIFIILALLGGAYLLSMKYFVEESKTFTVEKNINFPVEKVFPQFNNFQNFVSWNEHFSDHQNLHFNFYKPYQGKGSSMSFTTKKNNKSGEMYIRYENPLKTLKYHLYEGKREFPTIINIKFEPLSSTQTKTIWEVKTPQTTIINRIENIWTEDEFLNNLDASIKNLHNNLSNKVEKDQFLTDIKYDSLIIENMDGQLLLGTSVTSSNKKDALYKNLILNYNKVMNFVTTDLGKKNDELGFPVLITDANNFKDREVSYYLGIPLSQRQSVTDNNFNFRTVNASKMYTMYYKGDYGSRIKTIQKLIQSAKKDALRSGEVHQVFLESPRQGKEVLMKISLHVF